MKVLSAKIYLKAIQEMKIKQTESKNSKWATAQTWFQAIMKNSKVLWNMQNWPSMAILQYG